MKLFLFKTMKRSSSTFSSPFKKVPNNHFPRNPFKRQVLLLPVSLQAKPLVRLLKSELFYIKLEGVKLRFPLTWFRCTMARSYAVCTDLRTLGFLPSMRRSLSTVSSIPSGSSLSRGSHCLQTDRQTDRQFQTRRLGLEATCSTGLRLTKFSWCQRRALRRASRPLLSPSTRPV